MPLFRPIISALVPAWLFMTAAAPGLLNAQNPVSSDEELRDLANISFRNDIRLFAVMSALNRCGFDYEVPDQEMSAVRRAVRAELESMDSAAIQQLCAFYRNHKNSEPTEVQSSYTSLALIISGPPAFELTVPAEQMPDDVRPIAGFEKLLSRFYQETELSALWQLSLPRYIEELKRYQPVVKETIRQTLEYFRVPPRIALDRQIILLVDLLSQNNVVNARNMERIYYLVLGPAQHPNENFLQLQHEYLHFLVDPLAEKFAAGLIQEEDIKRISSRQPDLDSRYESSTLLQVTESLVEALLSRMHPDLDFEERRLRLFHKGLVLFPLFYRALAGYEAQQVESFPAYIEKIFKSASISALEEEERQISEISSKQQEDQEKVRAELELQRGQAELKWEKQKLLNEAGRKLSEASYDEAKALLESLLRIAPDNGNAYFYLGQIASQEKQHEIAFGYYQKAAQAKEVESWARAWAVLRSGNYLAYQSRFEEARRQFESVLSLEGELRGARQEALKALARLQSEQH